MTRAYSSTAARIGLVCVVAGALAGVAAAGRTGQVVRVVEPGQREVFVPAGTFTMGVAEPDVDLVVEQCRHAFERSEPEALLGGTFCDLYREALAAIAEREVTVSAFAIDRDEVGVVDYRKCVVANACELDPLIVGDTRYQRDSGPLVNVTVKEAEIYCRWRGGRLPTEAEWERAARGNDARIWPWGSAPRSGDFNHGQPRATAMREIDRQSLSRCGTSICPLEFLGDPDESDGRAGLAPPGSYPWGEGPLWHGYGTRDQAGNVAEWTADVLGITDPTRGYTGLSAIDPRRDGSLSQPHVVRGGSWRQPEFLSRADLRDPFNDLYAADRRFAHIGFRCARSLPTHER